MRVVAQAADADRRRAVRRPPRHTVHEGAGVCADQLHAVEDGDGRTSRVIFQHQPRANRRSHDTAPKDDRAFSPREGHCDACRARASANEGAANK